MSSSSSDTDVEVCFEDKGSTGNGEFSSGEPNLQTGFLSRPPPDVPINFGLSIPTTQLGSISQPRGFQLPRLNAVIPPLTLGNYMPRPTENVGRFSQPPLVAVSANRNATGFLNRPPAYVPKTFRLPVTATQSAFRNQSDGLQSPMLNAFVTPLLLGDNSPRPSDNLGSLSTPPHKDVSTNHHTKGLRSHPPAFVPPDLGAPAPTTRFDCRSQPGGFRSLRSNAGVQPSLLRDYGHRPRENVQHVPPPPYVAVSSNWHTTGVLNRPPPYILASIGASVPRTQFGLQSQPGRFRSPTSNAGVQPSLPGNYGLRPKENIQCVPPPPYVAVSSNSHTTGILNRPPPYALVRCGASVPRTQLGLQSQFGRFRSPRSNPDVQPLLLGDYGPRLTQNVQRVPPPPIVAVSSNSHTTGFLNRPPPYVLVRCGAPVPRTQFGLQSQPGRFQSPRSKADVQPLLLGDYGPRLTQNVQRVPPPPYVAVSSYNPTKGLLAGSRPSPANGNAYNLSRQFEIANSFAEATAEFLENVTSSVPEERQGVISLTSSSGMSGDQNRKNPRTQRKKWKKENRGAPKRPYVRRQKSPTPESSGNRLQRQGCVSQGSSSVVSVSPKKLKPSRSKGGKNKRSICTENSSQSGTSANENGTFRQPASPTTPQSSNQLPKSISQRGNSVIGNSRKKKSKSFRGRPVVEPEAESMENPPDHAPGSLAKFLSVVKWARRYTVTETGFYTINEVNTKSKIHKVVENNVGTMSNVCPKCQARYFPKEAPGSSIYKKCCKEGVVNMPPPPAYPEELKKLFLADDPLSQDFRRNIRQYNNGCAFAAFTHNSVALAGRGPKTYSVHGQSYHRVGSANAVPGQIPRYAQLYVMDSAMALQAREDLPYNKACQKEVFEIVDRVIRQCNPVCKVLMNMRECQSRLEEKVANPNSGNGTTINSEPANVKLYIGNNARMNIRQYAPPTTSEEISVIVPEDSSNTKPERYVTIFWRNNSLQHIHFANPLLDTLIYPLLFVHGQYGYSINLFSWEANKGVPSQLKPTGRPAFPTPGGGVGAKKATEDGPSTNEKNRNGNEDFLDIDIEFISSVTGAQDSSDFPNTTTNCNPVDEPIEDIVSDGDCPFEPMEEGELEVDDDDHIIVPENLRENPKKVTQMNFYAHMLHVRVGNEDTNFSPLHHSRKLFQQYLCDVFVRVEEERLGYIRREQERLRVANYKDLHEQINNIAGKRNLPVGTVVILPSSFTNGYRNMVNHYRDAMAIVGKHGKPDYFITFTCNPKWEEITRHLFPGQTALDRPDLVARVFELKAKEFKNELKNKKPFGPVRAMTSAIEYQKRGLPQMHLLLIVETDAKPNTAEKADTVVSAEIPCAVKHPKLHEITLARALRVTL